MLTIREAVRVRVRVQVWAQVQVQALVATEGGGTTPPYEPLTCVTKAVGTSPLRRLTHAEYDNAVRELLGDQTRPAQSFPLDTEAGLFDNTASSQTVPELLADKYLEAAAELAEGVANVTTLTGCDLAAATAATCVRTWVTRFGRKAYRRPLAADEVTGLVSVFENGKTQADAADRRARRDRRGARVAAFPFPPRVRRRTRASARRRDSSSRQFELAARLASLIWASLPDDTLLDAAAAGQLSTREQVASEARRMLADRRGARRDRRLLRAVARPAHAADRRPKTPRSIPSSTTRCATSMARGDAPLRRARAVAGRRAADDACFTAQRTRS